MRYRELGKTGMRVSEVGLGTEHLNRKPKKTVEDVIGKAVSGGINYFDMVFTFQDYLRNIGAALKGKRDDVRITAHIGPAWSESGYYRLSRDVDECGRLFEYTLKQLGTDHVDVAFIQMVNTLESVERVMSQGGKLDLAKRLKRQGKALSIGASSHKPPAAMKLVESGEIDVLMFPINIAWDRIPGRKEVIRACERNGVGLVAMKPFAGGRLFRIKKPLGITPVQCIGYVLAQKGVSVALPGAKNLRQLDAILRYEEASGKERGFSHILDDFQEDLDGNCVYCNHCLPCPAGIDIGRVFERLDRKMLKGFKERIDFYYPGRIRAGKIAKLRGSPLSCTGCGTCAKRCPFGVDAIAKMKQAAKAGIAGK